MILSYGIGPSKTDFLSNNSMSRNLKIYVHIFPSLSQIRMDESQEREARELADKLQHELEILTACQTKSKVSGDQQRARERRELEERVEVSSIHSCLT